ncbi:MAG: efflux RND transporter periplasmic adaptor subunit, partial [Candidatus Eisenbacteria bacterium]|nr:efflux RND transporter periplasmic adaptor subunit [Candidatus Eisenbacteria bacterium]
SQASPADAEPPRNVRILVLEKTELTESLVISGPLRPLRGADVATQEEGVVASLDQPKGSYVQRGQSLLTLDRRILQAEMQSAEAARTLQSFNEERTRALHDENSVSGQEMLIAHTQAEQADAQAEIARLRYERASIAAPFAGVLAERYVELGEHVAPGTAVARVVDPFTLKLVGSVTERDVASLQPGTLTTVEIEGGRVRAPGKVSWVGLEAEPASGKIPVEIEVANSDLALRPGALARSEVPTQVHGQVMAIPRDAILESPDGPTVFVADGDHAQRREIRTGPAQDGLVTVEEGLHAGDRLIVRGHRDLVDGATIIVQETATRPDGTLPGDPAVVRQGPSSRNDEEVTGGTP